MKLNIKYNKNISMTSGLYPIVTINGNTKLDNTVLFGDKILSYNNANVIINKTAQFKNKAGLFNKVNNIALNNSIISIKNTNNQFNHILEKNAFVDFPKITYNTNFEQLYGGSIISYDNTYKTNYSFVWSSNLTYDYFTKKLEWQKYNNNAIFVNDFNQINIYVQPQSQEYCKFADQYNIVENFFQKKNLINGFYKTAKFTLNSLNGIKAKINSLSLANNKNIYTINIPFYHDITCQSLNLFNIYKFNAIGLTINQLNITNSHIIIQNNNNKSNMTVSANNAFIQTSMQISGFSNIINTHIKTDNLKLSFYPRVENTTQYLSGYSIVENPCSSLLASYIFQNNSPTDKNIKQFFEKNILDQLTDYSLVKIIYANNNPLTGFYAQYKDTSYSFDVGTYTIEVYKSSPLSTFFTYNTYAELGNIVQSQQTSTIKKRNNNYMYGLEAHTHKMFSSINSSAARGTLFPTQSVINHEPLKSTSKSLLKQTSTISYYDPSITFKHMYLPQRSIIPIGSIINFYQINIGNNENENWVPDIPEGYYQVEAVTDTNKKKCTLIDIDNSALSAFNGQYVKMFSTHIKNGLFQNMLCSSGLQDTILYTNDDYAGPSTFRLIKIIKYAERSKSKQ